MKELKYFIHRNFQRFCLLVLLIVPHQVWDVFPKLAEYLAKKSEIGHYPDPFMGIMMIQGKDPDTSWMKDLKRTNLRKRQKQR